MDARTTGSTFPEASINRTRTGRKVIPGALPDTLEGFRNFHQDETIVVCGCGRSLVDFVDQENFITIGVNDIGRLFQPNYLVVLNPRGQFSSDRFDCVARSRAQALFTQLNLGIDHPHIVRFNLGQQNGVTFDTPNVLPYTRNSPYVALCLAALMGAKRIGIIGVDFTDDHFFGRTGRHPLAGQVAAIDQQYQRLREALGARGVSVINLSRESRLTAFPKGSVSEVQEPETGRTIVGRNSARPGDKPPTVVTGMFGIGDNLHQRAPVRDLMRSHDVWLETCHIALYHDLVAQGLKLLPRPTRLRAQARTIATERTRYGFSSTRPPPNVERRKIGYSKPEIDRFGSILGAMYGGLNLAMPGTPDFRLPIPTTWQDGARRLIDAWPRTSKQLMVLRQVILRREWDGTNRNPDPIAYGRLVEDIRDRFFVVSIANLAPGHEWIVGPELPADVKLHAGELDFETMAALFAEASLVVSPAGFAPVLAQAVGTPGVTVYGGRESFRTTQAVGAHLAPSLGIDPINPCDCHSNTHRCDNTLDLAAARGRLADFVSATAPVRGNETPAATEAIRLNYYAAAFDASGYGQAARLYIRALHAAGIKVSVVNTGARPAQVEDAQVAALLGEDAAADFNLFHGIPSRWAASAYRRRNVIAMTVWETDMMPQQWRNPLGHGIDVWLPCSFNVEVFQQGLRRQPFRLPHAAPDIRLNGFDATAANEVLNLAAGDFVFYSIFEWQDRKNPEGIIEAFLRAFPEENNAVLVLKSSGASAPAAAATLDQVRARTGSRGRVMLRCEGWEEKTITALHARGDCYVSLHKGEGWGYPLFEAACRGTPVVATSYAGPLDYLDAEHHWLVRCAPAPVRQRYAFYHSGMRWAEPDLDHAIEGLTWVYKNRTAADARALTAAHRLRSSFSFEQVGAMAKARLQELLRQSNPQKLAVIRQDGRDLRPQSLPIPGDWFDADYFEYGLKSNWGRGYNWPDFEGVFGDAGAYLGEMFSEARSFLDAGCAKGFLVKTLRQRGLDAWGFDHSPWAIAHAEAEAKPFIRLADTATVEFDRCFDVMVAMSLLEALTEEQIKTFMTRSRGWIQQALFATIPTLPPGTSGPVAGDRDLSRVTLRDREWWQRQFIDAGWRQDPLHRAFERACQNHSLPSRMSWTVYVFSPQ